MPRNYKSERIRQLHATQRGACQTKSFLFSRLTTQPRGLNFCLSFSRILDLSPVPAHESLTASRPALERRILAALDASPSRIPVVLGDFRTGRTQLLSRVRERLGRTQCQHIDLERAATTPERFYQAITKASPFRVPPRPEPASAREAFDAMLAFLDQSRTGGGNEPATFLLDEVLELRTFESFPGLRTALRELLKTLATSSNRFVLTTRYVSRAHRLLRDATSRFEVIHVPPLSVDRSPRPDALDRRRPGHAARGRRLSVARALGLHAFRRPRRIRAGDRRSAEPHGRRAGRRRSRERAHVAALARTAGSRRRARRATSCGCIARAATAR